MFKWWRRKPMVSTSSSPSEPPLAHHVLPDPYVIISMEMRRAFRLVLESPPGTVNHSADVGRLREVGARLRAMYDGDPALGPAAADSLIAWEALAAEREYHRDRREEAAWLERVEARGGRVDGLLELTRPMWREHLREPMSFY